MIYIWKCVSCSKEKEINSSVEDRDNNPGKCECGGTLLRVLCPNTFILKGDGWAKDNYTKTDRKED
jgi:predicted nucleic acid-binding Zn ribbon protein